MKTINKESILPFLKEMNKKKKVFCPQSVDGRDLMFMPLEEGLYTGNIGKTTISAKAVLFPQTEEILSFREKGISKTIDASKTLLFGIRPCEMKAIQFVDQFMTRDNFIDPHYQSRREKVTTIAIACHEPPSDTCFCVDAGGMPYLENEADEDFWEGLADRCINCGGCVYVCPTCTCFNVYDLPSPGGYTRYRSWDACVHAGFTRETSGHNPRPTQGSRLARRHEHKLKFDISNFGESGCVGCGRCSDTCPVGLGAIEIVQELNRL